MLPFSVDHLCGNERRTYGICSEQRGSAGDGSDMPSALEQIDRVDIISIRYARAYNAAHQLRENVRRHLLPWEVAERCKCNCDL